MKYSTVLLALVGVAAARHHHHHHHSAPQAPVVFSQEGAWAYDEEEKKPKGKKGVKGKKSKAAKKGPWTPADSRKLFEDSVKNAANVVKTQENFEKKQTSDIKKMNDKAAAQAKALRNKVGAARNRQMAGEYPQHPFPTVKQWAAAPQFLAETEADPKKGTPAWSYKEKADSLKAVRAAVAEQERFMAAHNKMVADNFAADDAKAKALRAKVSRARQTQLQGGLDY